MSCSDGSAVHIRVTQILSELCFSPKYSGSSCVRESIKAAVTAEKIPCRLSQVRCTGAAEKSIRTAIKKAWQRAELSVKIKYFGIIAMDEDWQPTNSEFIFMLAEKLRSDMALTD